MKQIIFGLAVALLFVASYYFIFSKEEWDERNVRQKITPTKNISIDGEITEDTVKREVFYTLPERALNQSLEGKYFAQIKYSGLIKAKITNISTFTYMLIVKNIF